MGVRTVARHLGDGEGSDHTTHEPQHHLDACEGHGRYLTECTTRGDERTNEGARGGPPFSVMQGPAHAAGDQHVALTL